MMLRCRKGFSIVEVVIALVIISIVSASALSIIMMSVNVDATAVVTMEVSESVDNAINCFRFAEDTSEFLTALKKTADYQQDPANQNCFYLNASNFTVTILVSENQFEYCAENADGEVIYSFIYAKDGAAANPTQVHEGGGEN